MASDIDDLNRSLAVDGPYLPDYESRSKAPHDSHTWTAVRDMWRQCDRCGTRDHWPGAERACPKDGRKKTLIGEAEAWNVIIADLERFFAWWKDREDLPTVHEWVANYVEWRRIKR